MTIKKCPKCEREPFLTKEYAGWFCLGWLVECLYCCLHTECCDTCDEAVAKWNEMTEEMQ